jgi:predicted nuclease of predicted toxin-antitoxin system
MNLYLDDDTAATLVARLLRKAGHDVQLPVDAGMVGKDDAIHLTYAIQQARVCMTKNHRDFENLHELLMSAQGHYPGILVIRQDNDPTRDLSPRGIVRARNKLLAAGVPLADNLHVLNHWR